MRERELTLIQMFPLAPNVRNHRSPMRSGKTGRAEKDQTRGRPQSAGRDSAFRDSRLSS